jgi:uncharacterized membrane protein YsdA (DUF1294 family)
MNNNPPARVNPFLFYFAFSGTLAAIIFTLVLWNSELSAMHSWLVGINISACFCMGLDKSLSRGSSLRIPETVLYVQALLGGVPGILLGVHTFKHKTRKAAFQFSLLVIAAAQVGLLRLFGAE